MIVNVTVCVPIGNATLISAAVPSTVVPSVQVQVSGWPWLMRVGAVADQWDHHIAGAIVVHRVARQRGTECRYRSPVFGGFGWPR